MSTFKFNKASLIELISQREIAIIGVILVALSMMMIPLPSSLMDVIIASNICLTVIVLMVVIYMNSPLNLSSFPSILLVLTTVRIGITVSTSRLILLNGDAGEIVHTFGEFVVGGNIVVGIIIFTIITIINFIVITKGAERVAEVSARFSLDGMPGRQMSIDSDLRANNITLDQAKQMRRNLTLESKLFGAMDGAMKFIKGDAIASIIDIIVNLIGGLIIGMVQHGMDFSQAMETYSILTVGDGLVQQIPALIISLSSGMMITRVNHEDEQLSLGDSLIDEIFGAKAPLVASGVILLMMMMIPGMPKWVFGLIIVILGLLIKMVTKKGRSDAKNLLSSDRIEEKTGSEEEQISPNFESWKLSPITISIAEKLKDNQFSLFMKTTLQNIQNDILLDLGVLVPNIIIRYSAALTDNQYQVQLFEIPVSTVAVHLDRVLYFDPDTRVLEALDIKDKIENTYQFGGIRMGFWVPIKYENEFKSYSLRYFNYEQFIRANINYTLRNNIGDFLGMQEVKVLLDKMNDYQDLIKEMFKMITLSKLTEILQRMIEENLSIRNFKLILDTILEYAQHEKEVVILTEHIRQAMSKYILHKFGVSQVVTCVILSENIEDEIRNGIRFNNNGSYLSLSPDFENKINESLTVELAKFSKTLPILVVNSDVRRYVFSIVSKFYPNIIVLSYQEIDLAKARIECLKVIDFEFRNLNDEFEE